MTHFRGNFLDRLGTPYESGVPCSGCPNDCESVAVGGGAQYDYIATNQIAGRFNVFQRVFYLKLQSKFTFSSYSKTFLGV